MLRAALAGLERQAIFTRPVNGKPLAQIGGPETLLEFSDVAHAALQAGSN